MNDDHRIIMNLVNSRLSLPLVYAECHKVLQSRMPARNMYVCIQEEHGDLRFPYYVDELLPEDPLDLFPKEGLTGYVIDTRQRYWYSRDPLPPASNVPVGPLPQDWIGVPLFGRDKEILGVLTVQTYESGPRYSESDADFLEFAAGALSLSIQLARQDRDIAIRRIAALVEETVEIRELYPRIHEVIGSIIPAARKNFIIARVDEKMKVFRSVLWVDEKDEDSFKVWPLDRGLSGYIYSVIRRSFIHDDERTLIPLGIERFGSPATYWLGAPLFNENRIIGMVVIQSHDAAEAITKEDEYALNAICPFVSSAIGQTELLRTLKRS
jgi:hypothetical protein